MIYFQIQKDLDDNIGQIFKVLPNFFHNTRVYKLIKTTDGVYMLKNSISTIFDIYVTIGDKFNRMEKYDHRKEYALESNHIFK